MLARSAVDCLVQGGFPIDHPLRSRHAVPTRKQKRCACRTPAAVAHQQVTLIKFQVVACIANFGEGNIFGAVEVIVSKLVTGSDVDDRDVARIQDANCLVRCNAAV